MVTDPDSAASKAPGNRLIAGAVVFVAGQLAPLAIPLVAASSLSAGWKTALSGLLLIGVPELAILLTVVILGKAGFDELKTRLWRLVNRSLVPGRVSRRRYNLGLVLFMIPVFLGWVSPYLHEALPGLMRQRLTVAIAGDVALVAGLCLMGGHCWDKLRALFIYDAQVSFPSTETNDPA